MAKSTLVICCLMLATSFCCFGADVPKLELFGGYSYLRLDTSIPQTNSLNASGWAGSVTYNATPIIGFTGEISGQYNTQSQTFVFQGVVCCASFSESVRTHDYNFLFGPRVVYRRGIARPFAHVLFGVSHGTMTAQAPGISVRFIDQNVFGMAVGGGLDIKVNKLVSIRIGQLDYLRTQFDLRRPPLTSVPAGQQASAPGLPVRLGGDTVQNHLRYLAGVSLNLK